MGDAEDDPLFSAARRAWLALAPAAIDRFPVRAPWEPRSGTREPGQAIDAARFRRAVPIVPTVPAPNGKHDIDDEVAEWEERAAIAEFDGGAERGAAEALAGPPPRKGAS